MQKKSLSIGYCYFMVFCLVFFSQEVLMFGTNKDPAYALFKHVVVVILFFVALGYALIKHVRVQIKTVLVVITLILFTLLTAVMTEQSFTLKYAYACLNYLFALLVIVTIKPYHFKRAFFDIMLCLAVCSLVVFAISYIFPQIIHRLPVLVNDANHRFTNMIVAVIPHSIQYSTPRNFGIFREPSAYQIFLNLAIMFGLDMEKTKMWKLIMLLFAVITTFSTAGYLICVVVVGAHILSVTPSKGVRSLVCVGLVAAIAIYLMRKTGMEYDSSIFRKLFTNNVSVNSRFGSIIVDLYLGIKSPIWGNGYAFMEGNFKEIAHESFSLKDISNTNTMMKLFAVHGIVPFVINLSGQVQFFKYHMNTRAILLNSIAFLMMLSSVEIMFNILIYIVMLYGISGWAKRERYSINENCICQ